MTITFITKTDPSVAKIGAAVGRNEDTIAVLLAPGLSRAQQIEALRELLTPAELDAWQAM